MTSNMTMMTSFTTPWSTRPEGSSTAPPLRAWAIAARIPDPDHPRTTIAEHGILYDVVEYDQGDVHVQIAPESLRARSVEVLRDLLIRTLCEEGYRRVDVELLPPRRRG